MAMFEQSSQAAMPVGFPAAEELLSAAQVQGGLERLSAQIQPLIEQHDCLLLGVLSGGMFPLVHLAQALRGDFLIDYCHATRYKGELRGGELSWLKEPQLNLQGLTVIIVDDIWDEGGTLAAVADYCRKAGAANVLTAVLLIKDRQRPAEITPPDFDAGLRVPDRYVFGCGMDFNNRWRHLSAIYALLDEVDEA
jgi:hypoxanthine phosphoribosyltransferase